MKIEKTNSGDQMAETEAGLILTRESGREDRIRIYSPDRQSTVHLTPLDVQQIRRFAAQTE
jgi:hypothetical protein